MKAFLFFIVMVPVFCFAQKKYVLLNRSGIKPAIFTDSVTMQDINKGFFPVPAIELDTLLNNVKTFRKLGKQGLTRKYFNNDDYGSSSIHFDIRNIKHAYGDIYDIDITSTIPGGTYKFKLSDPQNDSKKNVILINDFYSYLKQTVKRRNKMENK